MWIMVEDEATHAKQAEDHLRKVEAHNYRVMTSEDEF